MLLLHGQPGGARDWERVVAALAGRRTTIAFDRPGWDGRSRPCGLECNAQAALAALERSGAARTVVAGYSLGGAVAAWLAATRPERVSRLVLIAPAANRESLVRLDYLLATPVLGGLASAAALAAAGAALATRPLRRLISSELEIDSGYLGGAARRLLVPGTWGSFAAEQRMLIRELPLLEPMLSGIEAPATIMIGTSDTMVPLASARLLARQIPAARLVELERANHLLIQQHAEQVADVIAEDG